MSAPDFAAILAAASEAGTDAYFATIRTADRTQDGGATQEQLDSAWQVEARTALAAKVPELCQTCDGFGCSVIIEDGDCPDCPTIAHLLAIGAAVMTAKVEGTCAVRISPDHNVAIEADRLLQFLRSVQP